MISRLCLAVVPIVQHPHGLHGDPAARLPLGVPPCNKAHIQDIGPWTRYLAGFRFDTAKEEGKRGAKKERPHGRRVPLQRGRGVEHRQWSASYGDGSCLRTAACSTPFLSSRGCARWLPVPRFPERQSSCRRTAEALPGVHPARRKPARSRPRRLRSGRLETCRRR